MSNLNKHKNYKTILLFILGSFLYSCQTPAVSTQDIAWNKQNSLYIFEQTLLNKIIKLKIDKNNLTKTIYMQMNYPNSAPEFCKRQELFRHLQNAILKSHDFDFLLPLESFNKQNSTIYDWILNWNVKEKDGYCDWHGSISNELYKYKISSSYSKESQMEDSEILNATTTEDSLNK